MAYASVTYTSASGTTFALTNSSGNPIPYIRQSDIEVYVNNVLQTLTTDYTFNTAGTAIVLNSAVSGATVLLQRVTDIADATVVYTAGSTLTAQDLNNADNQLRYGLQEFRDFVNSGGSVPDGDKGDITVAGNGTIFTIDNGAVTEAKLGSNSVTSAKIVDGTIVNADINASAAIAGTKIVSATTSVQGTVQLTDSTSSTSTTTAATPNSVKSAYDLADAALPKAGGTVTGNVTLDNQADLRFGEATGHGGNWVAFQAPGTIAANVTWTLPNTDASVAGYALKSDGAGNLSWGLAGGALGGGTDQIFYENDQTVTTNYTISTNKNAMTAGPVTINSGVTVTVPSGSTWVVV